MAAASSMTSSSAWPSFTASPGWMYCWSQKQEGQTCSITIVNNGKRRRAAWFSFYLNGLPMLLKDVHPHHSFVELWIQRLDDFIVEMLLQMQKEKQWLWSTVCTQHEHTVADKMIKDSRAAYLILQSIKAFEDELKHGVEVVRARWGHKDIGVAVKNVGDYLANILHNIKGKTDIFVWCYKKTHLYPKATAPATASPSAADLPRPRAAVRATVLLRVFSEIASMNFSTPFA